jgi:hypothetical protein
MFQEDGGINPPLQEESEAEERFLASLGMTRAGQAPPLQCGRAEELINLKSRSLAPLGMTGGGISSADSLRAGPFALLRENKGAARLGGRPYNQYEKGADGIVRAGE